MAILAQISLGQEMELHEMACKLTMNSIVIDPPQDEIPFNYCGFRCDFVETVFCDPSKPDNLVFNDLSSIQFELLAPSSTATMFLIKPDGTEEPLVDNTYGTFFGAGAFPDNPLRGGYLIDWCKVYNAPEFGLGVYQLKTAVVNFGKDPEETISHDYKVTLYNVNLADGTIKIESIQNGEIEGGLDYTGMNWYQSIRLKGEFRKKSIQSEVVKYNGSDLRAIENQAQNFRKYEAEVRQIPFEVGKRITEDFVLSNQIFVTDYGIFTHGNYTRQAVSYEETPGLDPAESNGYATYVIAFGDRRENILKRYP
jgi:hypothetical protein